MRSLLYTTSRHTWRVSGRIPNASLLPTEAHCIGYDGTSYTPVVVRYIKRTDAFGTQSVSHTEAPTVRKIRHLNHWRCLINSSESCDFYTQAVGVTYWCGNSEWSLPPGSCDSQVLLSGSKKKKKKYPTFFSRCAQNGENGERITWPCLVRWPHRTATVTSPTMPRVFPSTHMFSNTSRLLHFDLTVITWRVLAINQSQSRQIRTCCISCPPSSVNTVYHI